MTVSKISPVLASYAFRWALNERGTLQSEKSEHPEMRKVEC